MTHADLLTVALLFIALFTAPFAPLLAGFLRDRRMRRAPIPQALIDTGVQWRRNKFNLYSDGNRTQASWFRGMWVITIADGWQPEVNEFKQQAIAICPTAVEALAIARTMMPSRETKEQGEADVGAVACKEA